MGRKLSEAHKKRIGDARRIFTPKMIRFVKQCAKEEKTSRETYELLRLEFERHFNYNTFRTIITHHKIKFQFPYLIGENNIKLFRNKKFKAFMRKHEGTLIYTLRDKIIERFEINVRIRYLRSYMGRSDLKIVG